MGQDAILVAEDLNAALKVRALFDRDACRNKVSRYVSRPADLNLLTRVNFPVELSAHGNLPRSDIRLHLAVLADGNRMILKIERSFKLPIDGQVFVSGELTAKHD